MVEFPHLKDTPFPNASNVNVYGYENVFDYTRWIPNTKLHLLNVRWNSDYADVVKFEDDDARDSWFDSRIESNSCTMVLESNVVMVGESVKVPVPYDNACRYNYLVVDVPVMTSDDKMLDYETADGYRRWHFFITGFDYLAPSTTSLRLSLDWWTQYINSVGISYMMLERGHAPVAATDTEKYLENPIANNALLLAPDVDFGGDTVSKGGKFIPFGNGAKLLCFASTCTPEQVSKIGTVTESKDYSWSDPVFTNGRKVPDASNRWSYQHDVSGYNYGNGKSYENTRTPAGNGVNGYDRIPNNTTVYAVRWNDADSFLEDCTEKAPMFLNTVQAFFMLDESMVTLGTTHKVAGHVVHECERSDMDLGSVKLTKDMFGIPERYQRFAKLYTYPYSELEITDNAGKSVSVRVESTGEINATGTVSTAYPYLNMRVLLTGIGGSGSHSYEWRDISGKLEELEMPNSDWLEFCFDMDIPCYALYMDGETSWELGNHNRVYSNARQSALYSYESAVNLANNEKANAFATADTVYENAIMSADTAKGNAYRSASAAKTNAGNDASNMETCNKNSRRAAAAVTTAQNSATSSNATDYNLMLDAELENNLAMKYYNVWCTSALMWSQAASEINRSVGIAKAQWNSAVANAASSAAAGYITGAGAGTLAGAAAGVGSVVGATGGLVGAVFSAETTAAVTNCQYEVTNAADTYNNKIYQKEAECNGNKNDAAKTYNTAVAGNNTTAASKITQASNGANRKNTTNTATKIRTNADNTYNAATANADATHESIVGNSETGDPGNAQRQRTNTRDNAGYTNRRSVLAAQNALRDAQNRAKAQGTDSKNFKFVQIGDVHGDYAPDYHMTRGVQVKARTQNEGAILCAGDEFARYGYKLDQIWDVQSLCLMKHFTYWKARECWVYDICETNDSANNVIGGILRNGTTVWSVPEEIGRVNPYDN